MIRRRVLQAKSKAEMRDEYLIENKLSNGYFRIRETSNSVWLVEGSDIWGHKVSRSGGGPDALLRAWLNDAAEIIAGSGH